MAASERFPGQSYLGACAYMNPTNTYARFIDMKTALLRSSLIIFFLIVHFKTSSVF